MDIPQDEVDFSDETRRGDDDETRRGDDDETMSDFAFLVLHAAILAVAISIQYNFFLKAIQ
jgi:hypothetical protein